MVTIFLTRKQYDVAIDSFSKEMVKVWRKCKTKWSLAGVQVTGTTEQIDKLQLSHLVTK